MIHRIIISPRFSKNRYVIIILSDLNEVYIWNILFFHTHNTHTHTHSHLPHIYIYIYIYIYIGRKRERKEERGRKERDRQTDRQRERERACEGGNILLTIQSSHTSVHTHTHTQRESHIYIIIIIIIIIKSRCSYEFPSPSLSIRPYHPLFLAGFPNCLLCLYRPDVHKFWLIDQFWHVHVQGSIEVCHLQISLCSSSSVKHVLFVLLGLFKRRELRCRRAAASWVCCFQDFFDMARGILALFLLSFFSMHFVGFRKFDKIKYFSKFYNHYYYT